MRLLNSAPRDIPTPHPRSVEDLTPTHHVNNIQGLEINCLIVYFYIFNYGYNLISIKYPYELITFTSLL